MDASAAQLAICDRFGVDPFPPRPGSRLGVAANLRSELVPLNGLRHPPTKGTSGWYLWRGEEISTDPGLFAPLHVEHLSEWASDAVRYLALPPGWRFLIAGDYEDVWFDPSLLDV